MAQSSNVNVGDVWVSTMYNNLRADVLDATLGHDHTGAADHGHTIQGEVYPYADPVGLYKRMNNRIAPTYPFDSALGGEWAWSAATGYVTPSSVTIGDSMLQVGFGSGQGQKYACLYLTTNPGWNSCARVYQMYNYVGNYLGPCIMDATAANVVASVIRSSGSGLYELDKVVRTGGGSYTVTALLSNLMPGTWYVPTLNHYGTEWTNWAAQFGVLTNGPYPDVFAESTGLSWTPTRRGLLFYTAQTTNADTYRLLDVDYYYHVTN